MIFTNSGMLRMLAAIFLAAGASITAAQAGDDREEGHGDRHAEKSSGKYGGENRGKALLPAQTNAKFQQECASCHIAYAPGLLPAESWRKMMAGLDKHFGTDASVEAQDRLEITAFLVNNSSNRWSAPTAPLRITDSAWFRHKHDAREISPSVWKNPQVKSPGNCAACHPQAERGSFNEHDIKIPN